jgi:hypothetical protein
MAKRGRPAKDKFAELAPEFKDAVEGATDEDILSKLGEVAKSEELNQRMMSEDEDLAEKKEAAKFAAESYSETTKANKLKRAYLYNVLKARGKAE